MKILWVAGHRARDPPDPIPNSEVKPCSVSGVSAVFGCVKPGKLAIHLRDFSEGSVVITVGRPNPEDHIRINRKHWDAVAVKNWPSKKAVLPEIARDPDSFLKRVEPHLFPRLKEIKGSRVIVLQFGDAHVMRACAMKGAEVTGVDFSSEQVRLAREAAEFCRVNLKLVKADCQNLPESIPESYFDLAVGECGIFAWIADLDSWMRNSHRALKSGAKLIVQDFHPISVAAKDFRAKVEDGIVAFRKSYLDQSAEVRHSEPDLPPAVEFTWKISDIINASIRAGFQIDHLEEFYDGPGESLSLIPNYFFLIATK